MFNSAEHFVRKCNLPACLIAHPIIMRINNPTTDGHKRRKPIYCDGGLLCELFQQGVRSAGRVMFFPFYQKDSIVIFMKEKIVPSAFTCS